LVAVTRRLTIGCEFVHQADIDTPAVFQVEPLSDQKVDVIDARWSLQPDVATRTYTDLYGNPCRRLIIAAGRSVINYRASVVVPDAVEDVDEEAPELTPDQLPDETLIFTLPSRFCLPDVLGTEAWNRFGSTPPGYRRVQAICDYVHDHLRFQYGASNPWTTAADAHNTGDELDPGDPSGRVSELFPEREFCLGNAAARRIRAQLGKQPADEQG